MFKSVGESSKCDTNIAFCVSILEYPLLDLIKKLLHVTDPRQLIRFLEQLILPSDVFFGRRGRTPCLSIFLKLQESWLATVFSTTFCF